jgi:hypothetical protein
VLTLPGEATLAEEMAWSTRMPCTPPAMACAAFSPNNWARALRQCYDALAPHGPYQPTPAAAGGALCATSAWATSAN